MQPGWLKQYFHQHVDGEQQEVGVVDRVRARETAHGPGALLVLEQLRDVQPLGVVDAALHVGHRISMDGDHVLDDLRERFDEVLATLEAVAGWHSSSQFGEHWRHRRVHREIHGAPSLRSPAVPDMDERIAANREMWDERVPIHVGSDFYDVESFRAGRISLQPFEVEEVGEVTGKTLLHLQCHFGIDTLSWARLGARVTGADFSAKAVELAQRLTAEIGVTVSRISQLRTEAFGMIREGLAAQYRDPDVDEVPAPESESKREASHRSAYAAAIAAQSTWRSRLDAEPVRRRVAV